MKNLKKFNKKEIVNNQAIKGGETQDPTGSEEECIRNHRPSKTLVGIN